MTLEKVGRNKSLLNAYLRGQERGTGEMASPWDCTYHANTKPEFKWKERVDSVKAVL